MKESPWTGWVFRSTTHTSPSGVDSTRGTRSASRCGASRSHRSGGGFTCESAEISLSATPRGLARARTYNLLDLGTLGGSSSAAWGINEAGQVVGAAATATGAQHAFLYTNGMMI